MNIHKRIMTANLVVVCVLVVPLFYTVVHLDMVGERNGRILSSGLDTIRALVKTRMDFEEVVRFHRYAQALAGDPDLRQKLETAVEGARQSVTLADARLRTHGDADTPPFPIVRAMIESAVQDASRSKAAGVTRPRPGFAARRHGLLPTVTMPRWVDPWAGPARPGPAFAPAWPPGAPPQEIEWSDESMEQARGELTAADMASQRWLTDESAATRAEAERAGRMGFLAFMITAPLAIISASLIVLTILRPLARFSRATTAVAKGKFGVELPVSGSSELAHLARTFNRMSASLAELDRMKADFINVVAHELKTPLACIKGYAGALRAMQPETADKDKMRYLDRIDREADLLSRRVSELLTFGVIEAGQLQLELRDVMTEGYLVMVAEAFRPIAAERRIGFTVKVDPGVPAVFTGDPDRLNQVLLNLLDNAFKFTPPGGSVRLGARRIEGALEIEVRDSGPGIPPEQLETIFEKYARVRSAHGSGRGGAGLGLAVARGIVLAHGGSIEAHSSPGKGSVFSVRLPIAKGEGRSKEVA